MDETVEERTDRRTKERTKLVGEVYKHFIKDNMTSGYQSRIIKIFDMVKSNKINSLEDAKKYYASLKPIQETRTKIID